MVEARNTCTAAAVGFRTSFASYICTTITNGQLGSVGLLCAGFVYYAVLLFFRMLHAFDRLLSTKEKEDLFFFLINVWIFRSFVPDWRGVERGRTDRPEIGPTFTE